jgi:restriction system protein
MLWTITRGVQIGDVVLSPDGKGSYYVGEVVGGYEYHKGQSLPHRRPVRWFSKTLTRDEMSESLRHSAGSIGTVSDITKYAEELERLLSGNQPPTIVATDDTIEDPSVFALEKHLEDFLVQNWKATELGKTYNPTFSI